jgi:hypothetical protein
VKWHVSMLEMQKKRSRHMSPCFIIWGLTLESCSIIFEQSIYSEYIIFGKIRMRFFVQKLITLKWFTLILSNFQNELKIVWNFFFELLKHWLWYEQNPIDCSNFSVTKRIAFDPQVPQPVYYKIKKINIFDNKKKNEMNYTKRRRHFSNHLLFYMFLWPNISVKLNRTDMLIINLSSCRC